MNERFVDFMYVLMRDHLTPGCVEEITVKFVEPTVGNNSCEFTNKGLEQYAREIVKRIEDTSTEEPVT